MRTARFTTAALLVTIASGWLTACGTSDTPESRPSTATGAPTTADSPTPNHQSPTPTATAPQEADMRIEISVEGERFQATLTDSAASRDLIAQLPLTLDMTDHGGVEKTGALPSELSLDGQSSGADPDVGDVGYYAPGNDLVLYYGNQSYYDGIVVLGKFEGDAPERLARMDGDVTVDVDRFE